jgi:hypothetical protein
MAEVRDRTTDDPILLNSDCSGMRALGELTEDGRVLVQTVSSGEDNRAPPAAHAQLAVT